MAFIDNIIPADSTAGKVLELGRTYAESGDRDSRIAELEAELAEQDTIMAHPDEHPDIKIDNDWYWAYGQKKEQLQHLMDDWGEKQMERDEVMAEYEK